jgi:hypothetical protein
MVPEKPTFNPFRAWSGVFAGSLYKNQIDHLQIW